jgi:hypothetical protein
MSKQKSRKENEISVYNKPCKPTKTANQISEPVDKHSSHFPEVQYEPQEISIVRTRKI